MIDFEVQQELGRAKNTIQDYFIRKLLVPKIYLDADWNGEHLDVLAIDRAGVGDVHAVRIISEAPDLTPHPANESILVSGNVGFVRSLDELKGITGHFCYLAALVAGSRSREYYAGSSLLQKTLARDGVGRIGILFIDLAGRESAVNLVVRPERYRSTPEIVEIADQYVAGHTANWEVRE